ncbi:2-oxo-4-hydroxy-4-carboxy-5-ureidoimidazoline decarboxylase [Alkalicoccobacillus murimartini]|uniref:2-oxo-4-hydroxy-4-carboxy-5-ureidoimidazoline decarboxylase n=1 Tax=Alkalicoccobacillus murimartini TaxID=171685 RepID=A0ABT9YGC5_9BACI|nr:2-oxo-4-hydroxy-4-carboxy-5-ureidoimidazoline decarboxylase [Alkalicoccobacillus murimartini]MDQ0206741.1 2-oxo-4-hydroxy-4-carboxy-5-ureidoimidazoline decarboxylase [Alkalicoccobacillus murimartini]
MGKLTLTQVNQCSDEVFIEQLGSIYEHSSWVAKQVKNNRPFSSVSALHLSMREAVSEATDQDKLHLLCAHPNLGEKIQMTDSSKQEQSQAGLTQLTAEEYNQFSTLNKQYMDRFHFPFIIAVKGKQKAEIYEQMNSRVHNSKDVEFKTALKEVDQIALLRLFDLIKETQES